MMAWGHIIVAPGFFQSTQVGNALWLGAFVAAISGAVGIFVVIRGQSFIGHVLTDVGAVGGAGSFLIGITAWYGFLTMGLLAGTGVELLGDRARNRDIATGIVLSLMMGLGALFLYFDATVTNNANVAMTVLFGSIFTVDPSIVPIVVCTELAGLLMLVFGFRPLLFSSMCPEIAEARGIRTRMIGWVFMLVLIVAAEGGALVVGVLLSTALLIGPAAAAIRITSRIGTAIVLSAGFGIVATWLGILLAYDSYSWPPHGRGWPVSFFIALVILCGYLVAPLWPRFVRPLQRRRS